MRVLVIINKWWECNPALAAMLSDNTRPPGSPWPADLKPARRPPELNAPNPNPVPRATFCYHSFTAEVWCVSDLLDGLPSNLQSSSEKKHKRLTAIFKGEEPGLVISVGTASTPQSGVNCNGGVAVGTSVFMHNGCPGGSNPDSNLNLPDFDRIIESLNVELTIDRVRRMDVTSALNRFLPVPLNASPSVDISIGLGDVAVGTINVTNPRDYAEKDRLTLQAFAALKQTANAVSLETTHGLIRLRAGNCPFLFVSGIVNRFQQFGTDVAPRADAQNTAGAHNAGVVVTWMLSSLDQQTSVGLTLATSGGLRMPGSTLSASELETLKAKLSYAWNVWEFHGRQRMSMFNYFLVIVGILVSGYITALKDKDLHDIVLAICLLGFVQCFVFVMIDWRNRAILYFADSLLSESEGELFKSGGPMCQRAAKESRGLFRFSKMIYWMWLTYTLIGIGFLAAFIRSVRGQ